MLPKTYVETSVISYLTARPSRDHIAAAHQQLTRDWWSKRARFDIYVSELVVQKASRGDAVTAADALHIALAAVNGMNFLVTWNCTHIANGFILQTVNTLCRGAGFEPPIVCTPEELMEG